MDSTRDWCWLSVHCVLFSAPRYTGCLCTAMHLLLHCNELHRELQCNVKSMNFLLKCPQPKLEFNAFEREMLPIETHYQALRKKENESGFPKAKLKTVTDPPMIVGARDAGASKKETPLY